MLLTLKEAASRIRCSKTHLSNVIHGKVEDVFPLRIIRIGRRVLVKGESLEEWLSELETRNLEARRVEGSILL